MSEARVAIETEGLTRGFATVRAVDGLSLTVPTGVVFGLLGPNGAGKTTVIRLLLGLLAPDAGRVSILGFDVARDPDAVRQRCGALLEHAGLYERLTAEENLEFYGRAWGLSSAERRSRIKELLSPADLWVRRREKVGGWSRGMKQQLAIARALLHRPELVFLDEPTAGLDPVAAAALRDAITGLASREGVTVFLTTHNLAEAERICRHIAIIRQGRRIATGTPDELRALRAPGAAEIRITGRGFTPELVEAIRRLPAVKNVAASNGQLMVELADPSQTPRVVARLAEGGAAIEEVERHRATLEDVFIELVKEDT
jgi:ABC-2 type transport system ATP-binding protein